MRLTDLPLDILHLIVEATIPESFENFTLACSTTYHSTAPFRQKYNDLRREFKYLKFPNESNELMAIFELLERIANEPIVARYIVHADLRGTEDANHVRPQPRVSETTLRVLPKLFEDSAYLKAIGVTATEWQELMLVKSEWPDYNPRPCLFLLTLLPNVVDLTLPIMWETFPGRRDDGKKQVGSETCYKLLRMIVDNANHTSKTSSASLSKLTTINPTCIMGYESRTKLKLIVPFLGIGSVQNLYTSSGVADGVNGSIKIDNYPAFGENLTVIEMAACVISPLELAKFLSRTPKLRSFSYCHEPKWGACGQEWDSGAFMFVIEEKSFETLEELSVSLSKRIWNPGFSPQSMKKFKRLRKIELDMRLLLGLAFPGMKQYEDLLEDQDRELYWELYGEAEPSIPRLIDLLPVSVESVVLITDLLEESIDALEQLFLGYQQESAAKLPSLKSITITCGLSHGYPHIPKNDANDPQWKRLSMALDPVANIQMHEIEGQPRAQFMTTFHRRFGVGSLEDEVLSGE